MQNPVTRMLSAVLYKPIFVQVHCTKDILTLGANSQQQQHPTNQTAGNSVQASHNKKNPPPKKIIAKNCTKALFRNLLLHMLVTQVLKAAMVLAPGTPWYS